MKKYKSKILKTVHESAKDLFSVGAINTITMKEYDTLCLPQIEKLNPEQIRQIRKREKISQPILAHILNVSPSTIKQWEQGEKHPSGAALKLLNLVVQKGIAAII